LRGWWDRHSACRDFCHGLLLLAVACLPAIAQQTSGEIQTLKVQGNVYLLTGAGGNIAVQTGDMGVLVVDTGLAASSDKVVAAIRKLSDKPIQYILNTHVHADHTGGNDAVRRAGLTYVGANVTGNLTDAGVGAQIYAQDNVLKRMSAPTGVQAAAPFGSWPTETYLSGRKQMFFNGEPVEMIYQPAAHTDGDSLVFFRRSDVVVTGDIFVTTSYPFIDLERGGSIQGEIDALNNIMELAVPGLQDEGGTYIIPGHGRICDQPDLLEYRDMVTIVRDRIQAAMKKGMTLAQVKAAGLTKDYDGRYGAKSGFGTPDNFVESIYKSLGPKK
jgi:glyoxylase-like metal-dependent hydrolase (beta-lactamase superfamily II)